MLIKQWRLNASEGKSRPANLDHRLKQKSKLTRHLRRILYEHYNREIVTLFHTPYAKSSPIYIMYKILILCPVIFTSLLKLLIEDLQVILTEVHLKTE